MNQLKYKRILLKISGEALQGSSDGGQRIDFSFLDKLCKEILGVQQLGVEIAIVVGGGNFWRFRDFQESPMGRVSSDSMGMLATVMNSIALRDAFQRLGGKAEVLSAVPMGSLVSGFSALLGEKYLREGNLVICAAGSGNPYFTTDSAAALRALELQCDIFLKATKVDYVYDKDPVKFPDAVKYEHLSYEDVLGKQLGVMDLSAITVCHEGKMPIMVFNLTTPGNIEKVVRGEQVGTIIS